LIKINLYIVSVDEELIKEFYVLQGGFKAILEMLNKVFEKN